MGHWDLMREMLRGVFSNTHIDQRTEREYIAVYAFLYLACSVGSAEADLPGLPSRKPLGHLIAPLSITQNHSKRPADDEDPGEEAQLGKRGQNRTTVYVDVPMKKKCWGLSI